MSKLQVDSIDEVTSANGVTVDGLNIKDSKLTTANSVVTTNITDVNVTEGKIADNAITLAKMASGTDGNIISYDASGNPVAVATGNSGQVLTSAGAGAVPSFQTPTVGDITSVVAGAGMTGGGTSGDVTLNVIAGTGIDVSADAVAVDVSDFLTNGSDNRVITATGADAMNGEANLTFDGTTLGVNGGAIFNESGADVDFRVESDASSHGLYLDGGTGNVGIGLSGPSYRLQLISVYETSDSPKVFKAYNNSAGSTSSPQYTYWDMAGHGGADRTRLISYDYSQNSGTRSKFVIQTSVDGGSLTDRFSIENDGDITITPKLQAGTTDASLYNNTSGSGWFVETGGQQTAANQKACADWNRMGNDGTILGIYQAGSQEGSISVSGSTVSYNGFTGTHWSRFTDNSKPTILRGTVLETLDEMCYWYNLEFDNKKIPYVLLDGQSDGDVITYDYEGTDVQATIVKEVDVKHMMSKVSDTTDAKNVYGLFIAYDLDGEGYNDFYVASVGSYVVRIKSGETLAKGDLLQSNGDGTAKVQSDDNIKSSSFAKVLSTTVIETYEDGSYLVPCSLMC